MTAVAKLEKHRSSVMSLWLWQCELEHSDPHVRTFGDRRLFQDAVTDLALHQGTEHLCPDCGGSGYGVNMDGTDNGACRRRDGHGVDLTAP